MTPSTETARRRGCYLCAGQVCRTLSAYTFDDLVELYHLWPGVLAWPYGKGRAAREGR